MKEAELVHCDHEIVRGPLGHYIQENGDGGGRGGEPTEILVEDGIKFFHQGKDGILWLVRKGRPRWIGMRKDNVVRLVGRVGITIPFEEEKGIHIKQDSEFLEEGDGFVVLPLCVDCVPGPLDNWEGRSRPTIYYSAGA